VYAGFEDYYSGRLATVERFGAFGATAAVNSNITCNGNIMVMLLLILPVELLRLLTVGMMGKQLKRQLPLVRARIL